MCLVSPVPVHLDRGDPAERQAPANDAVLRRIALIGLMFFMTFSGIYTQSTSDFPTRFMAAATAEMLLGLMMIAFSKFAWRRSRIA